MTAPRGFDLADEYMHAPTDHPQFNESMYFNFVDGKSGLATLIRMGNRANEGHAEVTVLVYLPSGGAAFHFERADIEDNSAFDAAGLRFEIVEPFRRSRVTFDGNVRMMAQWHGTRGRQEGVLRESPQAPAVEARVRGSRADVRPGIRRLGWIRDRWGRRTPSRPVTTRGRAGSVARSRSTARFSGR